MTERFYIITVRSMNTCDDCDAAVCATFVASDTDLPEINIANVAAGVDAVIDGAPMEGLRPMTREEVDAWRAGSEED
ncbi:hypothetical protein JQ608_06805 [Bradyrhizobium liaoningense]|uniref:hypothetical protein n=1 Tax=Bradyrhizobium liaoningense TaxID=43992 RepID=UPI001BAD3DFA|nr:hypothetical protein [Bradyrhizobium liaoningense]MBR0876911.1 hypothetical protein [Bradyrhizobium liaoningense]